MKLVLNDDAPAEEKKPLAEQPKIPMQKRIMISKEVAKSTPDVLPEPENKQAEVEKKEVVPEREQQPIVTQ